MSRMEGILFVLVTIQAVGCAGGGAGDAGTPANTAALDECVVGVWFHVPRDCSCLISVLDTPECTESDCRAADMILLRADHRYFSSVLRWSPGLRTLSAPGGRVVLTADWRVMFPEALILDRDTGVTTPERVTCRSGHLSLDIAREYVTAPANLSTAAEGASMTEQWLSVAY